MPMKPRPGQALASTVDSTTVLVVRAPGSEISLTCAGVEMWDPKSGGACPAGEADPAWMPLKDEAFYRDNRIDLRLTDVVMPAMDGIRLLRALKAAPLLANIPVILTTGINVPRDLPVQAFLRKHC